MSHDPRSLRRCAECGKIMPRHKLAVSVSVTTIGPIMWDSFAGPLCSIACVAVAAVRLLEQVKE